MHSRTPLPIGELTKLSQQSTVCAYQERFEELANHTTGLTEEFFVSCFISELCDDIKAGVQMFQPSNITQAMGLAKLQEESFKAAARRTKAPLKYTKSDWSSPTSTPILTMPKIASHSGVRFDPKTLKNVAIESKSTASSSSTPQFPIKRLTPKKWIRIS